MARIRPEQQYPQDRTIVFAGVQGGARAHALSRRKAEAIMVSFESLRKGSWWQRDRDALYDGWPQYRYLDSGVFTVRRKYGLSRISGNSQPAAQRKAGRLARRERVSFEQIISFYKEYERYLRSHHQDWDFIVTFDIQGLILVKEDGRRISGSAVAKRCTARLLDICGDKLIPVWHPKTDGVEVLDALIREHKYIAFGSSMSYRGLRYAIDRAKSNGTRVHGLAVTGAEWLAEFPYFSGDSSTWINGVVYGQYAGIPYRAKAKDADYRAPQRWLEDLVRSLGYDPTVMLDPKGVGESGVQKFEIGIALMQHRQAVLRALPRRRLLTSVPIL